MNTIELQLDVPKDFHERLIAELDELGAEGFIQKDDHLIAYVPEEKWGGMQKTELISLLGKYKVNPEWREKLIPDQDWNEPWEKSIQPIHINEFYVRPSWQLPWDPKVGEAIEIIIDPKMSFGTGHHETTRLVLAELSDFIKKGGVVLDAGAGTAILSIAAIKKGAHSVVGFDIDKWAIENGIENALRNGVSQQIALRQGSFEAVLESNFDLILANINLNVLIEYALFFAEKMADDGYLILSGVLRKDAAKIVDTFEAVGLQIIRSSYEGEWHCCVLEKRNNTNKLPS